MLRSFLLVLLLLSVALVGAQTQHDPFDAHCADILILQSKPVQKELKVSEAQRAKLNTHASWHQAELAKMDKELKDKKANPNDPKVRERLEGLFSGLKSRVLSSLSKAQVKRLREVSLQNVGDVALCDPVVAKRIGMSQAQLKKMQSTYQEGASKFNSLEQEAAQKVLLPYKDKKPKDEAEAKKWNAEIQKKLASAAAAAKPKIAGIRAEYAKRMKAILSKTQWSKYLALKGKPFKASA
jgi:Skp family chaperone for outer membrane proteins